MPVLGDVYIYRSEVCNAIYSIAYFTPVYEETELNRVYNLHSFVCSLFPKATFLFISNFFKHLKAKRRYNSEINFCSNLKVVPSVLEG